MKNAISILLVLGLVLGLGLTVYAVDGEPDVTGTPPSDPTIPVVALDDGTIQTIVDALASTEPDGDAIVDDTEPTIPQVDLTPDTVDAISQAVGASVGDAITQANTAADVPTAYAASGISGGYYFVCDCALGSGVKFWVPVDFASGSIAQDDGGLVNMTNSNIYLMPDNSSFSSYTIYASRFSHFQYRRNNYDYADLNIRNITDTNISFLQDTPQAVPDSTYFIVLIAAVILGILFLSFIKRG